RLGALLRLEDDDERQVVRLDGNAATLHPAQPVDEIGMTHEDTGEQTAECDLKRQQRQWTHGPRDDARQTTNLLRCRLEHGASYVPFLGPTRAVVLNPAQTSRHGPGA